MSRPASRPSPLRALIRLGASVSVSLWLGSLVGCGSPSSYDLCTASCDAARRCNYTTDTQAANCRTDCYNNKGKSQDDDNQLAKNCKNAGEIRSQQMQCYSSTTCHSNAIEFALVLASCVADPQANNCLKP